MPTSARLPVSCGAILLALLASTAASYGGAPADESTSKRAFDRARHHYNLGEFETALAYFKDAYQAAPLPALLFNIAQCHRNLGNVREAIFFFERYLEERPAAPDAAQVHALLEELHEVRTPPPPRTPEALPAVVPPPPVTTATVAGPPLSIPPPRDDRSIAGEWWFWTALLAGSAVIAGATVLAVRSANGDDLPEHPIATFDFRNL